MPRTEPFRRYSERYEEWFETFHWAYESEVAALASLRPSDGKALEVGVGTGRFAAPLDIDYGLDPAREMIDEAEARRIQSVLGVAEELPFTDGSFDLVLVVTTICFVEDIDATLREAKRVLVPGGHILLGYIDRESQVGRHYQAIKDENPFYREATFYSTAEVLAALEEVGFTDLEIRQTIFQMPEEMEGVDPVRDAYGEGSFVALRGTVPVT